MFPIFPTALYLPTVAIMPLSENLNGFLSIFKILFFTILATYFPCWIATGAMPGKVLFFKSLWFAASPNTKTSGSSFNEQSGSTIALP